MATLPPVPTISSSHLDDALCRAPFFSGEALSLRNLQKQRLPVSHSKQNASFSLREKASAWKISAMAASAPQTKLPFRAVEGEAEEDEDDRGGVKDEAAAEAEKGGLFDWNSQWYPVALIDDLDRSVPTAITVMGRHLVVCWDRAGRSWKVWDDKGPEMPQINGKRGSQLPSSNGSLECRSQNAHASVYPSLEQDDLLWFWPDTRPKFKDIAATKPPPSMPALTDPAFKDKLHSMNLPYGYKKMIENLLEPACVPFAHDEPEVDFLQGFEQRLSSTAGYPSSRRPNKAKQKQHAVSKTNGCAHEAENFASKSMKTVKNGSVNAKLEISYARAQNGTVSSSKSILSKANGSTETSVELPYAEAPNGAPGSNTSSFGDTNGSANASVEIPYAAAQSGAPDSSTRISNKTSGSACTDESHAFNKTQAVSGLETNGSVYVVESHALNKNEPVKGASENTKVQEVYAASHKGADGSSKSVARESLPHLIDSLQSGNVSSQRLLGESLKEEVLRMDRIESASRSSTSSQSSVVLKKPVTSSRPTFDEEGNRVTDLLNISSVSSENTLAGVMRKSYGSLDLTSGMQALRHLGFQKSFELAKGLAKELYQRYPGDTGVLMEYAFVEKQLGDLVAAGSLYSQAISAFEDQENLGYDYVRALQALGSIEARARNARRARVLFMESIRAARKAEQVFPDLISGASVFGLHAWARLEEQLGNWGKARDLLARAAEIQPGNAVIHQSRALLEAKAQNWGAARDHFSLATESAPADIKCWHAWAIFEASQGKQKRMRDLFQKALEVDPNSVHCLQAWAHQETLIGTPEAKLTARSLFQHSTKIEPKNLFSWQAWAVMEQTSGNYGKARELFEKCLEIHSSSVACLQAYANMERHLENWRAAQRLLRKALKLEPENAAVLMEAAFVENSLGNTEFAETLFVLAGMADKRKSRVRNRIFASRKEVMASEAGQGRRAFGKRDSKLSTSKPSTSFKAAVGMIKTKPEAFKRNSVTERQHSSHLKQGEAIKSADIHFKAGVHAIKTSPELERNSITETQLSSHSKKIKSGSLQVMLDAIKAKQRELNNQDRKIKPSYFKQSDSKSTNLQAALDAIQAKQREVKGSLKTEREFSLHLKQGEKKSSTNFQAAMDAIEAKLRELNSNTATEDGESLYLKQEERTPSMLGA